ncbi:ATP-binding cassette domain-containing protein [Nonomuraea sp. NPDC050556]|uniref:virginiamycin B lyase family protein n=1 Tax=Nonomuraea sp. NPDC050556 TaxID=3364369 RepID=UPI0037B90FE1
MEFVLTTQLTLKDVTMAYGERVVLDHVTLSVSPGERAGIVGENGSGKSTLLRLMAGVSRPTAGTVTVSGSAGHLGQTLGLPGSFTVAQAIDAALAEFRLMERDMQAAAEAEDMETYGELLTAYEARGGYTADARVDRALDGLGLGSLPHTRTLRTLSGGEQARLGLACVLAAAPEILLLDEPTNHLDASALAWLEERLLEHRGTVVTVSHDRVFLDRVAMAIIEVEGGSITRFGGGYTGFLAEKASARARWEQAYADWRAEIGRLREFSVTTAHRVAAGREMRDNNKMAYDRNAGRVQSSIAGRVRQTQERLRRLEAAPVPRPPEPLRFQGLPSSGSGSGERVLLCGPNGAGKSTVLRRLAARARGRVGYLPQEVSFDPSLTVLAAYRQGRPGYEDDQRRALLATGLFAPETLDVRTGELSEGQRRRLALARLLAGEHDALLLDEPTNHLSLTLVEELERALDTYRGTLVVVSHDRALNDRFRGKRIDVNQFQVGEGGPYGITTGPDGALWFTLVHAGAIGRITVDGSVGTFPLDPADGGPTVITPSPDGALWFTEFHGHRVGRITTSGEISSVDRPEAGPYGIAAGPDGAMWVTELQSNTITRIAVDGAVTTYDVPVEGAMPSAITRGPDDAMWFTMNTANAVGRITMDGEFTIHRLPTDAAAPVGITAGPDGALWFVEIGAGQIGRITVDGEITEYPLKTPEARPHAIVPGKDGLWFTEWAACKLGHITLDGEITEHDLPGEEPHGLTLGPDGAVWVAMESGSLTTYRPGTTM